MNWWAPAATRSPPRSRATPDRLLVVAQAFREGFSVEDVNRITHYDPWFLRHITRSSRKRQDRQRGPAQRCRGPAPPQGDGLFDKRLAKLAVQSASLKGSPNMARSGLLHDVVEAMVGATSEAEVRSLRHRLGVHPVFKRIDSCAAEFEAVTPYMYSTYEAPMFGEAENEAAPSDRKKIVILGGGPTASGRGSSSTIAAATPASRWKRRAMRRSWSTATRKR
jgi:carbamoyl-phosphate synthase large subunit